MNQPLTFRFVYIDRFHKERVFIGRLVVPDSVNAYSFAAEWFNFQYPGARLTSVRYADEPVRSHA